MDITASDRLAWWQSTSRACGGLGLAQPDIEDCFQSALEAFLGTARREDVRDPAGWIAAVARRRAIDDLRRRGARDRAELVYGLRCPAECPDVADLVAGTLDVRCLLDRLRELPPGTVSAVCALTDGSTAAEAAERLGTSRRSVESHRYRARRHFASVATAR